MFTTNSSDSPPTNRVVDSVVSLSSALSNTPVSSSTSNQNDSLEGNTSPVHGMYDDSDLPMEEDIIFEEKPTSTTEQEYPEESWSTEDARKLINGPPFISPPPNVGNVPNTYNNYNPHTPSQYERMYTDAEPSHSHEPYCLYYTSSDDEYDSDDDEYDSDDDSDEDDEDADIPPLYAISQTDDLPEERDDIFDNPNTTTTTSSSNNLQNQPRNTFSTINSNVRNTPNARSNFVDCPICSKKFRTNVIERHAALCAERQEWQRTWRRQLQSKTDEKAQEHETKFKALRSSYDQLKSQVLLSTYTYPEKEYTIEECTCVICMELFVEPLLMYCNHTLCKHCLLQLQKKKNSECPLCRAPVSDSVDKYVVNEKLESWIKSKYSEEYERRQKEFANWKEDFVCDSDNSDDDVPEFPLPVELLDGSLGHSPLLSLLASFLSQGD